MYQNVFQTSVSIRKCIVSKVQKNSCARERYGWRGVQVGCSSRSQRFQTKGHDGTGRSECHLELFDGNFTVDGQYMEKAKHDKEGHDEHWEGRLRDGEGESEEDEEEEEEEEEEGEEEEEEEDHDKEVLEALEGEVHALKAEAPEESDSALAMDSLTLAENNSGLTCNPSTRPSHSRSVSPESCPGTTFRQKTGIRDLVSSDLTKTRASQHRKYHSKRSTRRAGRPHGSKAKQDTRVKLDHSGVWD